MAAPAARRGEPPIEPWDWWWRAGEADRALNAALPAQPRGRDQPRGSTRPSAPDLDALGIRFDTDAASRAVRRSPSPSRTFGARPHRRADGSWDPGEPTVFANYVDGGLGDLNELVHETGHAIHIAAIRTRPAFADWPDSDALTEALAELVTLDVGEPAWNARWIDGAPGDPGRDRHPLPLRAGRRSTRRGRCSRSGSTPIPSAPPTRSGPTITSESLGVAPHPEWSWWAMRGQLVQEPGYMANYAVGAVLAADLRAAIRAARGRLDRGRRRLVRVGLGARLPVRAGAVRGRRAAGRARAARRTRPRCSPTSAGRGAGSTDRPARAAASAEGQRIQSGGRLRRRRIRM